MKSVHFLSTSFLALACLLTASVALADGGTYTTGEWQYLTGVSLPTTVSTSNTWEAVDEMDAINGAVNTCYGQVDSFQNQGYRVLAKRGRITNVSDGIYYSVCDLLIQN